MNLLSAMAEAILTKDVIKQCTNCGRKINKLNLAHIILAKDVSLTEDGCLYYGFIFCDEEQDSFPYKEWINSSTTISFNYIDFNKDEILTKLKKIQLLL